MFGYRNGEEERIPLPPEILENLQEGVWPEFAVYENKVYVMIQKETSDWEMYCYDFEKRESSMIETTDQLMPERLFGLLPR